MLCCGVSSSQQFEGLWCLHFFRFKSLLLTDPEYEGVKLLESLKTSGNTGSVALYYIPEGLILKILMCLIC